MGGSFGDLLAQAGLTASPDSEVASAPVAEPAPEALAFAPKVVLRRTKKGRGGRTVTLIQGIVSGQDQLLGMVKKQLGVGARREGDEVAVQGNQVERLAAWLEGLEGVRKVVRS